MLLHARVASTYDSLSHSFTKVSKSACLDLAETHFLQISIRAVRPSLNLRLLITVLFDNVPAYDQCPCHDILQGKAEEDGTHLWSNPACFKHFYLCCIDINLTALYVAAVQLDFNENLNFIRIPHLPHNFPVFTSIHAVKCLSEIHADIVIHGNKIQGWFCETFTMCLFLSSTPSLGRK